jgi:hypothetical protein
MDADSTRPPSPAEPTNLTQLTAALYRTSTEWTRVVPEGPTPR